MSLSLRRPLLVEMSLITLRGLFPSVRGGGAGANCLQGRAPAAVRQVRVDGHRIAAEGLLRLEGGHGFALRRPQQRRESDPLRRWRSQWLLWLLLLLLLWFGFEWPRHRGAVDDYGRRVALDVHAVLLQGRPCQTGG